MLAGESGSFNQRASLKIPDLVQIRDAELKREEFDWQLVGGIRHHHFGDVAIDPLDIGVEDLPLLFGQRAELVIELRVAVPEQTRELVCGDLRGAENLSQGAPACA